VARLVREARVPVQRPDAHGVRVGVVHGAAVAWRNERARAVMAAAWLWLALQLVPAAWYLLHREEE
jgi:hypothetical protein